MNRSMILGSTFLFLMGCSSPADPRSLPSVKATLAAVGVRLSALQSAASLTSIAAKESRLLPHLNASERDILSRAYLRFRVDQPSTLLIATDQRHQPFWLVEQGFKSIGKTFKDDGTTWRLFQKQVEPGTVGLGVDRLDAGPTPHYRVFVRSRSAQTVNIDGLNDPLWTIERPRSKPLASTLQQTTALVPSPELENSTRLAKGKVWKTHVVATRRPDQIVNTPGSDASTQSVLSWRTSSLVRKSTAYYRATKKQTVIIEVEGTSNVLETPSVLNDPEVRLHRVSLANLEPGVTYEYSVGDGTTEGMSPWHRLSTAPHRSEEVEWLYMGDPQCGLEGWGRLLAAARQRHPRASALLIAGDLVDRGNERTNWDHFFLRAAGVFEGITLMPSVGNHEYLDRGPVLYRSFFALPNNGPSTIDSGLVYATEVGDIFLGVLDSTLGASDPAQAKTQADWLDQALSKSRSPWKIVMFHHPLYASHPWRENLGLRDAWLPVLDKHRVHLVLQGHDHAYLRTYPLRAGKRADNVNEGTTYVVSVSGNKYVEQNPRDYTEVAFSHVSTYQTINVKPAEGLMTYRSFDIDGKELDRVEWRQPSKTLPIASRSLSASNR